MHKILTAVALLCLALTGFAGLVCFLAYATR